MGINEYSFIGKENMEGKKSIGERENDEVTIKIKGNVLERVLDVRGKRERETKRPVSMTEVVNGIIMGWKRK